jgi:hypothetical protein
MRRDDVRALLDHAKNQLRGPDGKNMRRQYEESLGAKIVPATPRIEVKNFMENLRSALDYLAKDIYEAVIEPRLAKAGKQSKKEVYFPYGKDEHGFKSSIGTNLPDLQALNPPIYDAIEAVQPHKSGNDWLCQLCRIVNEKKHDLLTPQSRTETQTMTASAGGASVTLPINNPNVSIQQGSGASVTIGGVPVRLSNQGIEPLGPGLTRTVTTWVSFRFADTNTEVLPLLEKALNEIRLLSQKVYAELP